VVLSAGLHGIWGYPFLDLAPFLDLGALPALDREICRGLACVTPGYTGGTLKWMQVTHPRTEADGYPDAMAAIAQVSDAELRRFVSLSDCPDEYPKDIASLRALTFGDETEHPFSREQAVYLSRRHGAYFPWKVCYHFLENRKWEDNHDGSGKRFSSEAECHFPETVAFIRSLPFREIGRCVLFGLQSHAHATVHRDTVPGEWVKHSLTLSPRGDKRFFLEDEAGVPLYVQSQAYWFNDMDWHGVSASPHFQYSIRIDGVYEESFLEKVHRRLCT
jgi:hypothetical protein